LLDSFIDVNHEGSPRQQPIHIACSNCHIDIVKLLLKDPRVNIKASNKFGSPLLHSACANGYTNLVLELLADLRIDPNEYNEKGETPLHLASFREYASTC